jgi:hypothetical protein
MRINVGNIKTVLVSVPPIEQQAQLVDELEQAELVMAHVAQSLADTGTMMNALLNTIFGGRP